MERATHVHAQPPDPITPQALGGAPIQAPPTRRVRKGLLTSIEELDALEVAGEKAPLQEEKLPPQPVNEELCRQAIIRFATKRVGDRRMLGSTLLAAKHVFEGHVWSCTVGSEVNKIDLEKAREEIVGYLREATDNPTLVMQVIVDNTQLEVATDKSKLSGEERMRLMADKNPAFKVLVERLKLRVQY